MDGKIFGEEGRFLSVAKKQKNKQQDYRFFGKTENDKVPSRAYYK